MEKADAKDANGIVQRLLINLLGCIEDKGALGIRAKVSIGWTQVYAPILLTYDQLGYPLSQCFEQVRQAGATMRKMEEVRLLLSAEKPKTLGGTIVRDRSIQMALAQVGKIISTMAFDSREDIDRLIRTIQIPFEAAEEVAANTMDGEDYKAIIELRAAIVNYLVSSSRPLPSMLIYQFHNPLPSVVISYRLYADASRYDEIRKENKIVHPAFCRPRGKALSR